MAIMPKGEYMEFLENYGIFLILIAVGAFLIMLVPMLLRVVVPTNEVHIVQTGRNDLSYGKDTTNGNTYFNWPTWIPLLGIQRTIMPVSVFALDLDNYEAYDQGRLPFMIDVKAFFRIHNSSVAAQRVSSFAELEEQLEAIVQGAVRTVLATNDIEEIMQGRGKFGDEFTREVEEHLANWGVSPVKNIELMDIRDANGSDVIKNIMAKKKSQIDMESRIEVAKNTQLAEISEVDSQREIELQRQEASQQVGLRTVENERRVQMAKEERDQLVNEQQKLTKEKEMEVVRVQNVKSAEINRDIELINADLGKQSAILDADGKLEATKKEAEGLRVKGEARASAEKSMLLAPVEAQTTLAREIGQNQGYQTYLVTIEQIKASQAVGMEQARAMANAEVKIIANSSSPSGGMNKVMDLFTSQGGQQIGAMIESFKNTTDVAKNILN